MDTAFEWGLKPWEWDRVEFQDRARMGAYLSVKRKIEGFQMDKAKESGKRRADAEARRNEVAGKGRRR